MASSGKKEEDNQHRHRHHHPDAAVLDGNEEDVDKEWEDFTRLMSKLRDSRSNRPNRPSQAFYPCPPPKEDDQQEFDPFDYLNTILSAIFYH
ncbi:hypothetical protein KQX54_018814 [Cotesia glomerata]|uniref:Uncharacterized protein n=1 Tax=Cotesia glomerata TaxID=32391 RepID=A0AAV7HTD8_COTGL|nr:hypothetical protein KQX54_018814 [Cotesia glomerata]